MSKADNIVAETTRRMDQSGMEPDIIQTSALNNGDPDFSKNLVRVRITDQIKELQTVLRDRFVEAFSRDVFLKFVNMFSFQFHACVRRHCQTVNNP